jgi:hypothetical protein
MNVEHKEYASKGVAGSGLGLGIAGTALGLLGGNGLQGLLGGGGCGNSAVVNRYESDLLSKVSALEADVKLRDANTYTMTKLGELRDYVDAKFYKVEERLCKQGEWNTAQSAALTCMNGQIAQLFALTKLVVPNSSICPGWGGVTIAPANTPTTAG